MVATSDLVTLDNVRKQEWKSVRCKETKRDFPSAASAARAAKCSYDIMYNAIKTSKAVNGYHYELI